MDEWTRLFLAGRDGDRIALAAWVRANQAAVWRLCAALVDVAEADDLTQETFVRSLRAAQAFRAESSARTWLLGIARRVCADAIRQRQRRRRVPAGAFEVESEPLHSTVEVSDLLRRLDPDRRAAFALTQLLGLSYAEAAEVCKVPIGTIRSRVARAREDLLRQIDQADSATG